MSICVTRNPRQIEKILIQFERQYHEALGNDAERLREHIMYDNLGEFWEEAFLAQVYEVAGLIKPACSVYHRMVNLVNKHFDLNRDIIEIGAGVFPVLGHYLKEQQLKLGSGTVTVYDSKLWLNYPTKAKLEKRYFNQSVTLDKNSLLVGLFPCQATEMILKRALEENLEFCVALCGCNHSDNPYLSTQKYHRWLIKQTMAHLSIEKRLKIAHFPNACFGYEGTGFPILIGQNKPKIRVFTKSKKQDDKNTISMV